MPSTRRRKAAHLVSVLGRGENPVTRVESFLTRTVKIFGARVNISVSMSEILLPLERLAIEANARLDHSNGAGDRVRERIAAGEILAEAKDRVLRGEPGYANWPRWVRENLKRSYRDANKCIAIARETALLKQGGPRPMPSAVLKAGGQASVDQTSDLPAPPVALPASVATAVTIETVKRDISSLSSEDRDVLVKWLMPDNEVQRDRHGNVLDPLPIRLRRVLYRLKKTNKSSRGRTSKYERHIYEELRRLALRYSDDYTQIVDLQVAVNYLVHDLTNAGNSQFSLPNANEHHEGLQELEAIVIELTASSVDIRA